MNHNKRSIQYSILSAFIFVFLIAGSACENPAVTDMQIEIQENNLTDLTEAFFNPQPEPPPKVYEFEKVGDPNGDWTGHFTDFREGRIQVRTMSSMLRGRTIHVVQTWMIVPPEPIVPPDPIVPPEPVQLSLRAFSILPMGMLC